MSSVLSPPGFKWFGSLTNLSQRHPPEKSNNKAAPRLKGALCGGAAVGGQSVDDRDSSLVAPADTVPLRQKIFRVKEETAQGESQWKAGEHVRDSPLLGVLSAHNLTATEQPQLVLAQPLPPTPNRASPLTSAPDSCLRGPSVHEAQRPPLNMTSCKQDVYEPMEPIPDGPRSQPHPRTARRPPEQETSKAAATSQEVGRGDRWEMINGDFRGWRAKITSFVYSYQRDAFFYMIIALVLKNVKLWNKFQHFSRKSCNKREQVVILQVCA